MPLLPGKYFCAIPLEPRPNFLSTVAVYGLEVPCGDIMVPAIADFPATVSVVN